MKLFTSLSTSLFLYLLSSGAASGNGVLIYQTSEDLGGLVHKRLVREHGIPGKLIRSHLIANCPKDMKGHRNKLVLCANDKGLEVLNSNPSIIESLNVFKSGAK